MTRKLIIRRKKESTLADLMREELPFGQCGYQTMHNFNIHHGAMSACVIDYLFILFKEGTPNYPLGIDKIFNGKKDDPRILMFMNALTEYEQEQENIHQHIFLFIAIYFACLKIPMDNLTTKKKKEVKVRGREKKEEIEMKKDKSRRKKKDEET